MTNAINRYLTHTLDLVFLFWVQILLLVLSVTKIQFRDKMKTGYLQYSRNISKSIKAFELSFYTNVNNKLLYLKIGI